ncbi:MAG: ECF transporter S component [Christensenellaceae bacterium]|nr:ECF transporter S component [Christensenellaceae bacterium]
MHEQSNTRTLVLYALFIALIFLLGLTPEIGFIYLPIAAITTVHIPVIVGGFQLGPKGGALFGFFFGLVSFIACFTMPDATSAIILGTGTGFGVYNLVLILAILFLPRILAGLFAALTYRALAAAGKDMLGMGAAALVGTATNTVLFLGGLYLLAFEQTARVMGVAGKGAAALLQALLGIVALNGVLEAVVAVILCCAAGKALQAVTKSRRG